MLQVEPPALQHWSCELLCKLQCPILTLTYAVYFTQLWTHTACTFFQIKYFLLLLLIIDQDSVLCCVKTDDRACSRESVGGTLCSAASYCTTAHITLWYAPIWHTGVKDPWPWDTFAHETTTINLWTLSFSAVLENAAIPLISWLRSAHVSGVSWTKRFPGSSVCLYLLCHRSSENSCSFKCIHESTEHVHISPTRLE